MLKKRGAKASFLGAIMARIMVYRGRVSLFHENEINGGYQTEECREVIPVQALSLEEDVGDDGEYDERHAFLYHLELDQGEGTAVVDESDAVGWHLATVFEEGDSPTEGDDAYQWPVAAYASLLQFEMAIPSQGHKDVA